MENEKEVVVTTEEEAVVEEAVAIEEEVVTEEETTVEEEVVEEEATEFKKKEEEEEDKNDKEEASENEDNTDDKKEDEEEEDEDKKKKKYSLDEIPEYQELSARAADLEKVIAEYELKVQEYETQISELSEFKLSVEKKEKEALIEQFYMVSEEDKKDIIDNIDTYSYDEIKSKLSVFCFDNGINFSGKEEEEEPIAYNLTSDTGCTTPDWVKAALETQKELEY